MKYKTGHIDPFWDDGYKKFNYERQPLMDSELNEWESLGYHQGHVKSFSGCMYDNRNPMPKWVERLDKLFGLKNQTYNFYRMSTHEIMPPHKDHYNTYIRLFNADPKKVCRVLIMLENWKSGHYLEINGQGFTNWRAGDYFMWENYCPHAAANIGLEDRYTLQITGELLEHEYLNVPTQTELTKLHWANIPNLTPKSSVMEDFIFKSYPSMNEYRQTPIFVYMGNSYIRELENVKHSDSDVGILNKTVIHVFLYEPVCSFIKGVPHNQSFFSEYTYETDPQEIRVEEFDSINRYITNNNLDRKKVFVHTCEYTPEQAFPFYKDKMNLICDDLFIKIYPRFVNLNDNYSWLFQYNFICTTWRYSKHRHLVTAYLSRYNSIYNWYYKCSMQNLAVNSWIDLDNLRINDPRLYSQIASGVKKLNDIAPTFLDVPAKSAVEVLDPNLPYYPDAQGIENYQTPADQVPQSQLMEKFYSNSFCAVVCETRYAQHAANFSEKVYQAIQYKRPFIVVGPPKTLEYIRSLGFKTFDGFWDESYDLELNHETRLIKLFKLFDWVNSKTYAEISELYNAMQPLIAHNFNLLASKFMIKDPPQTIKESKWKEKE